MGREGRDMSDGARVFQLRVSLRLHERVMTCSRREGVTFNEFVREAIAAKCSHRERAGASANRRSNAGG